MRYGFSIEMHASTFRELTIFDKNILCMYCFCTSWIMMRWGLCLNLLWTYPRVWICKLGDTVFDKNLHLNNDLFTFRFVSNIAWCVFLVLKLHDKLQFCKKSEPMINSLLDLKEYSIFIYKIVLSYLCFKSLAGQ